MKYKKRIILILLVILFSVVVEASLRDVFPEKNIIQCMTVNLSMQELFERLHIRQNDLDSSSWDSEEIILQTPWEYFENRFDTVLYFDKNRNLFSNIILTAVCDNKEESLILLYDVMNYMIETHGIPVTDPYQGVYDTLTPFLEASDKDLYLSRSDGFSLKTEWLLGRVVIKEKSFLIYLRISYHYGGCNPDGSFSIAAVKIQYVQATDRNAENTFYPPPPLNQMPMPVLTPEN